MLHCAHRLIANRGCLMVGAERVYRSFLNGCSQKLWEQSSKDKKKHNNELKDAKKLSREPQSQVMIVCSKRPFHYTPAFDP